MATCYRKSNVFAPRPREQGQEPHHYLAMGDASFDLFLGDGDWRLLMGLAGSVGIALVVHFVLFALLQRLARKTPFRGDNEIVKALYQPARWLIVLFALAPGMAAADFGPAATTWWRIGSAMALAALIGWLALSLTRAGRTIVEDRTDITVEDNLMARRRMTRVRILNRIVQVLILFLTISFMLMAIPAVRSVGLTLVASAGLAALAVGAAAQPALKNLIAGIQMAFTEPIRLDDVVIVEGEWGRIEDIRLTYAIVRIWDDRRLVVPISYFLEKPFQNWTHEGSALLGTVFFYVDHTVDVRRIREAFLRAVRDNPRWDRRAAGLQVTDHKRDGVELRGLVSARDAGALWDLRCEVREAVLDFIRTEMQEAIARDRLRFGAPSPLETASPQAQDTQSSVTQ